MKKLLGLAFSKIYFFFFQKQGGNSWTSSKSVF